MIRRFAALAASACVLAACGFGGTDEATSFAVAGDLDQRGASAGCFRVREADSIQVWEFLQVGDPVVVISN